MFSYSILALFREYNMTWGFTSELNIIYEFFISYIIFGSQKWCQNNSICRIWTHFILLAVSGSMRTFKVNCIQTLILNTKWLKRDYPTPLLIKKCFRYLNLICSNLFRSERQPKKIIDLGFFNYDGLLKNFKRHIYPCDISF